MESDDKDGLPSRPGDEFRAIQNLPMHFGQSGFLAVNTHQPEGTAFREDEGQAAVHRSDLRRRNQTTDATQP
eukprot:6039907-Amphidinium_carterae.1